MNAITYTGNGSASRNITGVGFQPDFVWYKSRSNATYYHGLFDSVRGAQKFLASNVSDAEATYTDRLNAFISDGFTVGNNTGVNENTTTYAAWSWKAGSAAVSNTSGSISSTVNANTTAGFSIITYTGNGISGATVGHGLGVAPKMVITKKRGTGGTLGWWATYHASLSANTNVMLNDPQPAAGTGTWTSGIISSVSSSTFTVTNGTGAANVNDNTYNYVAYAFAEVAGFSKFGSYVGNGSTDGPFAYCGFRPRWILIKSSTDTVNGEWILIDTARSTYNANGDLLRPNATASESAYTGYIDILSNGFKLRNNIAGSWTNSSGQTYIFAAFAEAPFQYSRAR
jgi:hypothetical protein